jgi:hypothetical protein
LCVVEGCCQAARRAAKLEGGPRPRRTKLSIHRTPHPNAHLTLAFCLRCQPHALYSAVQLAEIGFMLSALGGGAVGYANSCCPLTVARIPNGATAGVRGTAAAGRRESFRKMSHGYIIWTPTFRTLSPICRTADASLELVWFAAIVADKAVQRSFERGGHNIRRPSDIPRQHPLQDFQPWNESRQPTTAPTSFEEAALRILGRLGRTHTAPPTKICVHGAKLAMLMRGVHQADQIVHL